MFGSLGGWEILFVFVLALLLFGPRKLPEIGRTVGHTLAEFRKATRDFKVNLEREIELEKLKEVGSSLRDAGRGAIAALASDEPLGAPAPGTRVEAAAGTPPAGPETPDAPSGPPGSP